MGVLIVVVGGRVLVTPRSTWLAAVRSAVVADAVLLAAFGSGSLPLTVAVFVMVPEVGRAAWRVRVEVPVVAVSLKKKKVTVPVALGKASGGRPAVSNSGRRDERTRTVVRRR